MERKLFGGAIILELPPDLLDASDLRQVPDNQEVFLFPNNDVSVVIEVLQAVDRRDPIEAAKFHFEAIADDNSASSFTVNTARMASTETNGETPTPVFLTGVQTAKKFNGQNEDEVHILLALYRVTEKNVDLVLVFNAPSVAYETGSEALQKIFNAAAQSLRILDLGLFA